MNNHLILTSLSMSVLTALSVSVHANNKLEETVKLDTIVVTASSQAVNIKEAPASISVITREDIEKQPVTSLGQLLSKVPGVTGGIREVVPLV
mgnify:CR=1 FL=1